MEALKDFYTENYKTLLGEKTKVSIVKYSTPLTNICATQSYMKPQRNATTISIMLPTETAKTILKIYLEQLQTTNIKL